MMLSEAFKRLRKPIIEGKKIKVYRFSNLVSENRFRDFALLEGWGWEDVFSDMLEDHTVQRLIKDVRRLMYDGWSADMVEEQLDHLIDKASTRLTSEEKTVLLKWIEKNETELKGPERGLAAFNRRQRQSQQVSEARYAFSDFECEECGTTFAEKDAFAGPIDKPKKPIENHYELFCPNCGSNNVNRPIREEVEPLDPHMDLEDQLVELTKRMDAARRGLGLANKLSGRQQTQHRRQVMINLNKIRRDLFQVVKELERSIEPTIPSAQSPPRMWIS